jgi:predicted transcriptional regulator
MEKAVQPKQAVRELLDRLPDDCTLDDVLYHLYVLQAVENGQSDVAAGRTIPHQQVVEELRKKWQLGDGG